MYLFVFAPNPVGNGRNLLYWDPLWIVLRSPLELQKGHACLQCSEFPLMSVMQNWSCWNDLLSADRIFKTSSKKYRQLPNFADSNCLRIPFAHDRSLPVDLVLCWVWGGILKQFLLHCTYFHLPFSFLESALPAWPFEAWLTVVCLIPFPARKVSNSVLVKFGPLSLTIVSSRL